MDVLEGLLGLVGVSEVEAGVGLGRDRVARPGVCGGVLLPTVGGMGGRLLIPGVCCPLLFRGINPVYGVGTGGGVLGVLLLLLLLLLLVVAVGSPTATFTWPVSPALSPPSTAIPTPMLLGGGLSPPLPLYLC